MPATPSRPRLRGFYAIIDPYPDPSLSFAEIARAFVRAGCPIIQLRMKGMDERDARKVAGEIRPLIPRDRLFIVNDFVEIARDVGADGAHVGQDDTPPSEARDILGPDAVIGLSTHNLRQARMALGEPVDYIGFGPVFATRSKPNPDPVTGVEGLREAVGTVKLPVVALGGITLENLDSVLAARPAMVCSIAGAIAGGDASIPLRFRTSSPARATQRLLLCEALRRAESAASQSGKRSGGGHVEARAREWLARLPVA